jgi:tetratricopeptide (TPR) repeat protein
MNNTVSEQLVQSAVQTIVSPQSTFEQKQIAWGRLRDSGKLDNAISELEQGFKANPSSAEYPAALGLAYLQKAGTIQDIREQGVLGLKADQTFEAALNNDSNNWEARFWKTTAMSYWPPQLNKGKEVIDEYLELIKQQETQAPQPHFAQTYALLGDQYEKQGQKELATEIWQRGISLYPGDSGLRKKTSSTAQ